MYLTFVHLGEEECETKSSATRHNRHLVQRVGAGSVKRDEGVAALVVCSSLLGLLRDKVRPALGTHVYTVWMLAHAGRAVREVAKTGIGKGTGAMRQYSNVRRNVRRVVALSRYPPPRSSPPVPGRDGTYHVPMLGSHKARIQVGSPP